MSKELKAETLIKLREALNRPVKPTVDCISINGVVVSVLDSVPEGHAVVSSDVMVKLLEILDGMDDDQIERRSIQ